MHGLERIPEVTFFARGDTLRRGHSLKIYKERSKREPRRNFFSRVVIPWNALPEKVVCSRDGPSYIFLQPSPPVYLLYLARFLDFNDGFLMPIRSSVTFSCLSIVRQCESSSFMCPF